MNWGEGSSWGRRRVLQTVGVFTAAATAFSYATPVGAQSSEATVTIEDQESDGDTVVLASVQTDVEAQLIIISDHQVDGTNINYRTVALEPGTDVTDQPLELTEPIPETQEIRAEIWKDDDYDELLARDNAHVTVDGESTEEDEPADHTPSDPAVELIQADSDAGFHFPYLLYKPTADNETESVGGETRPLLVRCSPRRGETSEKDQRLESGLNDIKSGRGRLIADELNTPTLVALLPSRPEDGSFGNLDHNSLQATEPPMERLDLQLLAMVEDARQRLADEPYEVPETVHMDGFSANGEFAEQFTLLHPERVSAVSSGGNGAITIPRAELDDDIPTVDDPEVETLPWPIGVADLDELVGEAFDEDTWMDVSQFRYIGAEDQWDPDEHGHPSEYRHAQSYAGLGEERQQLLLDIFGWEQVDERFETSRSIYENVGAPTEFTVYDGIGHDVPEEILTDIVEFHRQQMDETFGSQDAANDTEDDEASTTEPTDEPDSEQAEPTAEEQPGFGVIQAIAAVGGLGYLIKRRVSESE